MKCPKAYRKNYKEMAKNALAGLVPIIGLVVMIGIAFVI